MGGKPFRDKAPRPSPPSVLGDVGAVVEVPSEDKVDPSEEVPWPAAQSEKDNAGHRPFRLKQ